MRARSQGAVVLVARNGKIVYEKAFGYQNREGKVSMKPDAIFRIASMSKPITSVAVMMLVEEGKIDLAVPVSQYLPEFNDLRVGTERAPVKRPMTVQDLLRHTSGLTYWFSAEDPSIKQAYEDAKLMNFDQSLAEMVTKLAKLPLVHQPGTAFGIQHVDGCAGTHCRSGVRNGIRPVRSGADREAAQSHRNRVLGQPIPGGQCCRAAGGSRYRKEASMISTTLRTGRNGCREAAGWSRRPRIMCGSARCC